MTVQEAIILLGVIDSICTMRIDDYGEREHNAIHISIEALEKQIPKTVEIEPWNPAKCPSCGHELSENLGDGYYKHLTYLDVCPNAECCQRLDWGNE